MQTYNPLAYGIAVHKHVFDGESMPEEFRADFAKFRKFRGPSWRSMLNRAINAAARVTIYDAAMQQSHELARIKAKAEVYAANNPQPRAVYLLG